jgi:hypothetical protein
MEFEEHGLKRRLLAEYPHLAEQLGLDHTA